MDYPNPNCSYPYSISYWLTRIPIISTSVNVLVHKGCPVLYKQEMDTPNVQPLGARETEVRFLGFEPCRGGHEANQYANLYAP